MKEFFQNKKMLLVSGLILVAVVVAVVLLITGSKAEYVVTFDTDGGSMIKNQMIEFGNIIKIPENPEKNGYVFKYWSTGEEQFDLSQKITEDITLKAIYEKINPEEEATENKETSE